MPQQQRGTGLTLGRVLLNLASLAVFLAVSCFVIVDDADASSATITATADADVRSGSSADDAFDRTVLFIKQTGTNPNVGTSGKAYIRFDLPSDFGWTGTAEFTMTRSLVGAWSWEYDIYGLDEGVAGEIFTESEDAPPGITWNNAPGNDTASTNGVVAGGTTYLGSWQVNSPTSGGYAGDQYSINPSAVSNFLNSDINGSVTFIVTRDGDSTSHDHWASSEDGTYDAPTLSFTYIPRQSSSRWDDWVQDRAGEFPISSWSYFMRYSGSVSEYQTYAGAGLTMANVPRLLIGGATAQVDNAVTAGVDVLLGQSENLHINRTDLVDAVTYASSGTHNVIGYTLKDEPEPDQFEDLRWANYYIYQNDQQNAIPIANLLPNYAWAWGNREQTYGVDYEGYVQRYIDETHPTVIGHTHYPLLSDGSDRQDFYDNLELFRDKALENDIGLFGFVLVTDHTAGPYRRASGSDIRWQVNSHLAYGAKALYYYNYRIDDANFGEGIVDHANGNPTDLYTPVQTTNDKVSAWGATLLDLESTGVFHTGNISDNAIPTGTTRYTTAVAAPIDLFWGKEFLMGVFFDEINPSSDRYMLLVNKRHGAGLDITSLIRATAYFTLDTAFNTVYYIDPATGLEQLLSPTGTYNGKPLYEVVLEGGDASLMRFTHMPEPGSVLLFVTGAAALMTRNMTPRRADS